jgi:enoyl-[acyl-carrier-protein] reductase (NADH)
LRSGSTGARCAQQSHNCNYLIIKIFYSTNRTQPRVNPEDIASAVAWLIEGADAVTGQVIVVDAGAALGAPVRRK